MYEETIPRRKEDSHYYGDAVRALFLVGAILLIVAQSTGVDLPLSTLSAVLAAALMVIAAGVTTASQKSIHWLNALLAISGSIIFGTSAVTHYRAGINVFDGGFLYIEALAIIFLIALYFTTRTIRGFYYRSKGV